MNKTFEKEYTLRAGDFDKFNRIKPSAVLDLFQDAAGRHAEQLGVGFIDMLNRNYLWVLTRIKFEILSAPERYGQIKVKTWPLAPNRLSYRREYCITDQNGKKLIIGSSDWVVIDSEKRKFLSVPDLYPFTDGFNTEMMFPEKLGKIHDFEAQNTDYTVNAGFSDLDTNDHVNNTKYANFVLDAINPKENEILKVFQIDYRKEVMQGTTLNIHTARENNILLAKGVTTVGDTTFVCKIELET